jgi:hypothetical protein
MQERATSRQNVAIGISMLIEIDSEGLGIGGPAVYETRNIAFGLHSRSGSGGG